MVAESYFVKKKKRFFLINFIFTIKKALFFLMQKKGEQCSFYACFFSLQPFRFGNSMLSEAYFFETAAIRTLE